MLVDGTWTREWFEGKGLRRWALELRDPNSGAGADPRDKPRHQFMLDRGFLTRRVLPPAAVGKEWRDDPGEPWWEPVLVLTGALLEWWLRRTPPAAAALGPGWYAQHARLVAGHVAAYTPNRREVRWHRLGGVELQPPRDNYWLRAPDVRGARRLWFAKLA